MNESIQAVPGTVGGGVAARRSSRVVAADVAGVAVVLAGIASAVLAVSADGVETPAGRDYTFGVAAACIGFGLLGTVIIRRGAQLALGAVSLSIGALYAIAGIAGGIPLHTFEAADPSAIADVLIWISAWTFIPAWTAILTLLLLLLPDGRLPSRRWRPVAIASLVAIVASGLGAALSPYWVDDMPVALDGASNPFEVEAVGRALQAIGIALTVPCVLLSIGSLVRRFRRSSGFERDQLKWVALGGVTAFVLLISSFVLSGTLGQLVFAVAMCALPAGVAVAVLRHGLWDVDLVINRSLVYAVLTAIVVGLYVGAVALLAEFVARPAAGALAAAVVAVAAQPLHARLQRAVNRLIYGDRDDPLHALRRLGERLVGTGEVDEVLPAAAETVARALRLPRVVIEVDGGERAEAGPGSGGGGAVGAPLAIDLLYRGEHVGTMTASPRHGDANWSRADIRALETIARQVAVAAHAVRLSGDLRRSRERLVLAREEERRRIRRDLHDDLGPRLAALALDLETARDAAGSSGGEVGEALDRAAAQARAGIADVRRLVYDLRPPTLDDLGLASALREQAERLSSDELTIGVRASGELRALPAAVEAAAYRIAAEAMTNVVRHARASRCEVVLEARDGRLVVTVADDGRGIDATSRAGVGLGSMRERAEELGGTLEVGVPDGGGTRLVAVLPGGTR